mgnify:CR=1 FL=1
MLRFILQNSGIGELFGNLVGSLPLPMVLVAFLVAAVVRISVGSATVSMTMAAGIIASMPMVSGFSQLQLATITIAIAAGGTAFSHVNDSGFWLSKSLFEIDEKTNLKTWTAMETIIWQAPPTRSSRLPTQRTHLMPLTVPPHRIIFRPPGLHPVCG